MLIFCEWKYGFSKCLLTTSCTDALEMDATKMLKKLMLIDQKTFILTLPIAPWADK